MGMFDFFKKKQGIQEQAPQNEISEEKKKLLKKGKELGLNLDPNMSVYEMEHRIAEAKPKEQPKTQSSQKRGEY